MDMFVWILFSLQKWKLLTSANWHEELNYSVLAKRVLIPSASVRDGGILRA